MRKLIQLVMVCCMIAMFFTGCRGGLHFEFGKNVYTEDDMSHFYSEKVAMEELKELDIESVYADFEIIASDGYYIEYSYYYINNEPFLSIEDGKLSFSDLDMNTGNFSINMKKENYLRIYIPTKTDFESIKVTKSSGDCYIGGFMSKKASIKNNYGDTIISNCEAEKLDIEISSGKLEIGKCNVDQLEIENSYGQVLINDLNVDKEPTNQLSVLMSSGQLEFERINCEMATVENSYGQVEFSHSTIAKLQGKFSSGSVSAKECKMDQIKIENSYGNVDLGLIGYKDDYIFEIENSYGSSRIGNDTYQGSIMIDRGGERKININVASGNIKITFSN